MSKQFSEVERCVQVAKGLRELADRFEACEFVPFDFRVENEVESKEDWSTGVTHTRPTGFRRLDMRFCVKSVLSLAQEETALFGLFTTRDAKNVK